MIDEAGPDDEPDTMEFVVGSPAQVSSSAQVVRHWLETPGIAETIGSMTTGCVRMLLLHAEHSLRRLHEQRTLGSGNHTG